jgi:Asp-tRNA(Asn)/Glu-tRNA(Gln) amidotransferase C subunit
MHVVPVANAWREDEARRFPDIEKILENAPEREESFFKVRKVIE